MRTKVLVTLGVVTLGAAVGCASILSIPDRTADWCNRPENAHDFCDDFDHEDAGGMWASSVISGSSMQFVASSDTLPNALDLSTVPLASGVPTVAGMFRQFTDQTFDHVRVGVDVRFVSIDLEAEGGSESQLGFLLLEEQDFCIGVVLTPGGMGIVMRAHTTDCTSVSNLPTNIGTFTDDAGLTEYATVAPIPTPNQWLHLKLDVKRNANGSGVVGFNIDYPGVVAPPQIPAGFLTASPPAVAVATSVVGPSGHVDLQFDNVTVDFSAD